MIGNTTTITATITTMVMVMAKVKVRAGPSQPSVEHPPPSFSSVTQRAGAGVESVRWRRFAVPGVILVAALVVAASTKTRVSGNAGSRMATIEALVHHRTFVIDDSTFAKTVDKVRLDGHFYSSKPPVLSTLAAGFYWLLHSVGISFASHRRVAVYLVNLVFGLGPLLFLLVYFVRLLELWLQDEHARILSVIACAFGFVGVGYATTINNHVPAAAALLASFYYAFAAKKGALPAPRAFFLAGLLGGLAPTLDMPALFVSSAIGIYLLVYDWRVTLRYFASAAVLPLTLHFTLTYISTGSFLPIYLRHDLYLYPGSYWLTPRGIDTLNEPKPVYLFHMLVGHHGLFAMTPLFLLAAWALVQQLRHGAYRAEALVVGVPLLVLIVFYTLTTSNYGGLCVGFRWLIIVMPLLFLFVARWLEKTRGRGLALLFWLCLAVSAANAIDALDRPWKTSRWHALWQ